MNLGPPFMDQVGGGLVYNLNDKYWSFAKQRSAAI